MALATIPAVFVRGGTSKALVFDRDDLPPGSLADTTRWDPIFLAAMGSPDPSGRQLDGMGGGISSLSKIAIVGRSARPDADVDYTFGQVGVDRESVGYRGNCGNISAAIGPYALEKGLVAATGATAAIRIYNTNTDKVIVARFPVEGGLLATEGDFSIDGVSGKSARIGLEFLDPGGASTGRLLPTGQAVNHLAIRNGRDIAVSLVDAANPVAFIDSGALGLDGREMPAELEEGGLLNQLEEIRVAAAVAMGLASGPEDARTRITNLPLLAIVSAARDSVSLAGRGLAAADCDIVARFISAGNPHRAIPMTGAMCTAIAAGVPGSIVAGVVNHREDGRLNIAHPSGIIQVSTDTACVDGKTEARSATVYRTARTLMTGQVHYRTGAALAGVSK